MHDVGIRSTRLTWDRWIDALRSRSAWSAPAWPSHQFEPVGAGFDLREAQHMEARTADGFEPLMHTTGRLRPGRGAELVAGTQANYANGFIDAARQRPDMLAADASVKRMELADGVRALTLAVDIAETI